MSCFVCLWRSNYDPIHVAYPIQGFCEHSKWRFSSKPEFRISRWFMAHNAVMAATYIFPFISYMYYIPEACNKETSSCLLYIVDATNVICCVLLTFILFTKTKFYNFELNCWVYIFVNPKEFGLNRIVENSEFYAFRKRRIISFVFILLVNTIIGFLYFYFPYDHLPGGCLRKYAALTCYGFMCYGVLVIIHRIKIVGLLYEGLKKSLYFNPSSFDKYSKLICLIHFNMTHLNNYMMFILIIWICLSTFSLIINIYVLIDIYGFSLCHLGPLEGRTLVTILGIVIVLIIAEQNLNRRVSTL